MVVVNGKHYTHSGNNGITHENKIASKQRRLKGELYMASFQTSQHTLLKRG